MKKRYRIYKTGEGKFYISRENRVFGKNEGWIDIADRWSDVITSSDFNTKAKLFDTEDEARKYVEKVHETRKKQDDTLVAEIEIED